MESILFSNHYDNYFQFVNKCKELALLDYVEFTAIEDVLGIPSVFLVGKNGIYLSNDGETLVNKDEPFINVYNDMIDFYGYHLEVVYALCKDILDNADFIKYDEDKFQVNVYTKIYGGIYKHPEVDIIPSATPLIANLKEYPEYIPMNDIIVYDMEVNGSFLNFDIVRSICEEAGLDCGVELHRGLLNTFANKLDLELSKVPGKFGLPPIDNNEMYGIIVRPVQTLLDGTENRLYLKKENKDYE